MALRVLIRPDSTQIWVHAAASRTGYLARRVAKLTALFGGILLLGTACSTDQAPPGATLTVVSYNIRHGAGTDDVVDLVRTAEVLRRLTPDIVGLQEVDERAARSGSSAQADSLATLLDMHAAFGSFMDYDGGQYGMGILSRHPIVSTRPVRLPEGNEPRIALRVDIALPSGDTIAVFNVHFDWVENDTLRFAQASVLASVLDTVQRPYLLLGDFNDTPESRTLALFRAVAQELPKPADDHLTFSSTEPVKEIDFIFSSPASAWTGGAVTVIDEPLASDHRPLRGTISRVRP